MRNAQNRKIGLGGFQAAPESRLPRVLYFQHFSMSATLYRHKSWDINLQRGTVASAQLCKFSERHARRSDGISSLCSKCPGSSPCPFPLPCKSTAAWPHHVRPYHHPHGPPRQAQPRPLHSHSLSPSLPITSCPIAFPLFCKKN